ncbi:hypothetical protein CAAN1_01S03840 [[Candida] anglica]
MKFYSLPPTKAALVSEIASKKTGLSTIWYATKSDTINAPSTLPVLIKSKEEINRQVAEETRATGLSLKWKQSYTYGKTIFRFYKGGVANVWKNNTKIRALRKEFMISNQINSKGERENIRLPNFTKLTQELAQHLYMVKIEQEQVGKTLINETSMVKKTNLENDKDVTSSSFNITREQYQLLKRTPKDFLKLPTFAVIFMIFVEMTPILCYALPEITPSTCVLPTMLPRLWNSNASKKLVELRKSSLESNEFDLEDLALKTAYNIPKQQVQVLVRSLRLVSKYVPVALYPEPVLRRRLQAHYNYLEVDDNFLSTSGNVWNLSEQELVLACLERNLILDVKESSKLLAEKNQNYVDQLRFKLLVWLLDAPKYNVGYIGLNHLQSTDQFETKKIHDLNRLWKLDNPTFH